MGIKKYILISLVFATIICRGANPTLSGTNEYTGKNTYDTSNQVFNAGLQIQPGFWLNGIYITNILQLVTNAIAGNSNVQQTVINLVIQYNVTNALQYVENGSLMVPTYINGATNAYWIDYGVQYGGPMYGTIIATNANTVIIGTTNSAMYKLFSFNVVASGTNSKLFIPTAFTHFTTNGWTTVGSYYTLTLTNGNEFRMTVQTNLAGLSTQWQLFGQ